MIQNLVFGSLFLKILFLAYNFFVFVQMFQWKSEFFLISDFLAESLKANKIQRKRSHSFYYTVSLKNLIHFTNLNSLDVENNMLPQHSQKPF